MTRIKDGWLVEPRPVFFDDEESAWNFADVYGGIPTRAKRHIAGDSGAPSSAPSAAHGTPSETPSGTPSGKHSAQSATPSDQLGELTEDDFAC